MRVGIIGAGPAGTVCALTLLREAALRGQQHEVLLFDRRSFAQAGPRGCNMCAGVISATLLTVLTDLGAQVPPELVQRYVDSHYFETRSGSAHIPRDPLSTICTVFRSAGPRGEAAHVEQSFDQLLLRTAQAAGARQVNAMVEDVSLPTTPDGPYQLHTATGETYAVDVLVGAFGVNSTLPAKFEALGFGYRRPDSYHVCQAELPLDDGFIDSAYGGEIKIFSLGLPGIRFGALVPKRQHVTATVIGRDLHLPDLQRFLNHPRVRRHFPPGWEMPPVCCHCHPRLPVTAARHPIADRLLIIGDANIARYLKGGIESAFFTGALAAEMILAGTLSRTELTRHFLRPCHAKYLYDNLYGKLLFACNDLFSRIPALARANMRLVERERQYPRWDDRRHTRMLWHIFTGEAPYAQIFREAISFSFIVTMLLTLLTPRLDPSFNKEDS